MTIYLKKGVTIDGLKQPMDKVIRLWATICDIVQVKPVVTDGVRPYKDKERSLHPHGLALDLRTRDMIGKGKDIYPILDLLKYNLGREYDVILYDSHIHVEYQKFLDDQNEGSIFATEFID